MLDIALSFLLGLIFPNMETRWLRTVLRLALPVAIDVVRDLTDRALPNDEKFDRATTQVAEVLDTAFEGLDEWKELDIAARDRIRAGLVELALFIYRVSDGKGGGRAARRTARRARRAARE